MNIANEIRNKIDALEKVRGVIKERGENKARMLAEYDKTMAIEIIQLKMDGQSVTLIDKIARGNCYRQKLDMETADAMLKSATTNLQALIVEITALQSLLRHLDNS